jgi:hypothetical protein
MRNILAALAAAILVAGSAPLAAQVRTIDPNQAVDGDLDGPPAAAQRRQPAPRMEEPYQEPPATDDYPADAPPPPPRPAQPAPPPPARTGGAQARAEATTSAASTFERDDLIGAGEGVFGKGAEGFGQMIERILRDQGRPNAYIAGREASGAFVVGLRYGSGIMTHKVEGQREVYWTGP